MRKISVDDIDTSSGSSATTPGSWTQVGNVPGEQYLMTVPRTDVITGTSNSRVTTQFTFSATQDMVAGTRTEYTGRTESSAISNGGYHFNPCSYYGSGCFGSVLTTWGEGPHSITNDNPPIEDNTPDVEVALNAKLDGAFTRRPESTGYQAGTVMFRGLQMLKDDLAGDGSPLGEVFVVKRDKSYSLHEPVSGSIITLPAQMTRVRAALWL